VPHDQSNLEQQSEVAETEQLQTELPAGSDDINNASSSNNLEDEVITPLANPKSNLVLTP
jgi:hypothetical protein